jgi:uncharacterized protein (DUF2062 family)/SAM-dependent methyltransferase
VIRAARQRIHEIARQIVRQHTSPARLAAAVWVGAIVGCTPLFGLHLPLCIALAFVLGLNQVVVYGAANISIPPLVPFIAFSSVQLGSRLLGGGWMPIGLRDVTWRTAPAFAKAFFVNWLVGGAVVGAAIGAVGAALTYAIARARRRHHPPPPPTEEERVAQLLDEAARRYRGLHPRFSVYAKMKYRMDPCYRAILPHVAPGTLTVDLGTGLGMLPVVIALAGEGRRAVGVEWDREKLAAGKHAARALPEVELRDGDARQAELPACDVITLVDMLHYYDAEAQRALLARCRAALRPGGRILVREGDAERRGGARWTRMIERLAVRLGWNRGPSVRFRPVPELVADLEALGLRVRVDEVAGRLHPGNVLLVAEAAAAPSVSAG